MSLYYQECVGITFFVKDEFGNYLIDAINSAARKIYSIFYNKDPQGKSIKEVLHHLTEPEFLQLEHFLENAFSGSNFANKTWDKDYLGKHYVYRTNYIGVFDQDKKPEGVLSVGFDITYLKKSEQKLREMMYEIQNY